LRTYAITDISWDEGTRNFYREMSKGAPGLGIEFRVGWNEQEARRGRVF
jgi:hypothetical protein